MTLYEPCRIMSAGPPFDGKLPSKKVNLAPNAPSLPPISQWHGKSHLSLRRCARHRHRERCSTSMIPLEVGKRSISENPRGVGIPPWCTGTPKCAPCRQERASIFSKLSVARGWKESVRPYGCALIRYTPHWSLTFQGIL